MRKLLLLLLLSSVGTFAQNLLPIKKNNLWGFINDSGKVIIEAQFDFVGSFGEDGLAMAKKKGVFTLVDRSGWQLSPDNAQEVKMMGNSLFLVKMNNRWGLMNKQKEFLVPPIYSELQLLNKQLLAAKNEENKWGCLRINSDTICDFVCEHIYRKSNGWIQAKSGKQTSCYNENGLRLFSNENDVQLLDDNYFLFKEDGLWGVKNKMGDVVERAVYVDAVVDIYGFVRLNKSNRSALFSLYHGAVVADSLSTIYLAKSNVFLFGNYGLKGLIGANGKVIIPAEYVAFHYTGGSIMAVTPNNKWRLYTQDGKRVLSGDFDQCDIYQYCNIAVVRMGNKWGVGNLFEKELYPLKASKVKMDGMNIKVYEDEKLTTITVDSNGTELERTEFQHVSQIKIRKKRSEINWESFAVSTANINRTAMLGADAMRGDTLFRGHWFYLSSRQRWGLRNNKGKVVIPPTFSNVLVNQEKGYTVVYSESWTPNNYVQAGHALNPSYTIGIYDHVNYKYLLPVDFTSLRYDDFLQSDFARCIPNFENAKIAVVNLQGLVHDEDFKYIGEFHDGKARCLVGGKLITTSKRNDSSFIDYRDYFNDLKGMETNSNFTYPLMSMGGKWGFINTSGTFAIPAMYTIAEDFNQHVSVAAVGNKWGMISDKNTTLIPFQYDKIVRDNTMGDSIFLAILGNEKWGVLEENGRVKTTAIFDEIFLSKSGYLQYSKGRYLGVLDSNYNQLFEDTCSKLIDVGNSNFIFRKDSTWTKINLLTSQISIVTKDEADKLRTPKKEANIKSNKGEFDLVYPYVNNRAIVRKDGKYNYINEKGKTICNEWFDEVENYHNNFAVVKTLNKYFKIDFDGHRSDKSYQLLRYLNNDLYLAADSTNSFIVDVNEDTIVWLSVARDFQLDREVGVMDIGGKKGLINAYSDFVIAPKYTDLQYLGNGKYKYKVNAFTTIFDIHGNRLINIPAENIEVINADLFMVEAGNRIGYLKRNGEWLWPMSY
jgi:hypothetical protein